MSGRVKLRSLRGGTTKNRKDELIDLLYAKVKVKFTKILSTTDSFVVICATENDVDKLISCQTVTTLKRHDYEVSIPPHLRAKKSVVLKGLDEDITKHDEEDIKRDIEERNSWANVEEVIKMRNLPHMLKLRFSDIAMAKKATEQGLCSINII